MVRCKKEQGAVRAQAIRARAPAPIGECGGGAGMSRWAAAAVQQVLGPRRRRRWTL